MRELGQDDLDTDLRMDLKKLPGNGYVSSVGMGGGGHIKMFVDNFCWFCLKLLFKFVIKLLINNNFLIVTTTISFLY